MTTSDKNLGSGTISATTRTTVVTVPVNRVNTIYNMVLTNTTSDIITVSVYQNDGADRLFEEVKIPAGAGKAISVRKLSGIVLQQTQSLKLEASSANTFNYIVSGVERT